MTHAAPSSRRCHTVFWAIFALATGLGAAAAAWAQPVVPGDHEVWELSRTGTTLRWVVIHNMAEGKTSGVFHIEVLERRLADPAWKFTRLAPHMAVTAAALRASIRKPLRSGRVYPESFDQAFAEWQRQHAAGAGTVCGRTVLECLKDR